MKALFSLIVVIILVLLAYVGVEVANLDFLFGIVIPYAAILVFLIGFVARVVGWGRSAVPFKITTTCGQQKSHPWIKRSPTESPSNKLEVVIRMLLEVLLFRSLFRNVGFDLKNQRLRYNQTIFLWIAGLAFHYSFLVIFLRHFRIFMEPTPFFVEILQNFDGFLEIGVPAIFISDLVLLAAATYLFLRRVAIPQIRYLSLPADYFPLFLILGIAVSGVLMQQFFKVNMKDVKELTAGLFTFHPTVPSDIGAAFYIHLFLVSALLFYFPFSKLMHMAGIFMSPTRNLANNSRQKRHVNPWNYPVTTRHYSDYEDEFREFMKEADMPLEKE